jgi:ABC-type Fe3+/spermidine/putrescine transport system ATPase subunit
MTDHVITTQGLTKFFGGKCVLNEVSFAVPRGSVTAFLGRNGSGKTTTLRILLGLLLPTRGSSTILGHDSQHIPPAARGSIGYLAENHPVIPWMTVRQAGEFQAAFFSTWNQKVFDAVVDHFALDPKTKAIARGHGVRVSDRTDAASEGAILQSSAGAGDPFQTEWEGLFRVRWYGRSSVGVAGVAGHSGAAGVVGGDGNRTGGNTASGG